jgi:hypothetical protein
VSRPDRLRFRDQMQAQGVVELNMTEAEAGRLVADPFDRDGADLLGLQLWVAQPHSEAGRST